MTDRSALLIELTRALAEHRRTEPLTLRLCLAFVRMADADAGVVSLGFSTSERTLVCATDETAERLEDVQDTVREGPSLDAFRSGRAVQPRDLDEQRRRWPSLTDVMPDPIALVHAFPMRPEHATVGVVSLHLRRREQPSRSGAELAFLADAVGAAIIGGVPSEAAQEQHLWGERDEVSQATGMVIAQLGIGPADALAVLRAHAFAHETTVADVSRRVLARRLGFGAKGPDPDALRGPGAPP